MTMRTRFPLLGMLAITLGPAAHAQVGGWLEFDGNDTVFVEDPIHLNGPSTYECWVRCDELAYNRILSNRAGANGFDVDIGDEGNLRVAHNGHMRAGADVSAFVGGWFHLAITWAGPEVGTIVVYVNGSAVGGGASTFDLGVPAGGFHIGSFGSSTSYGHVGGIDEVRVWSVELDADTITSWMDRHLDAGHPAYQNLEAAWQLEEEGGQVASSVTGGPTRDGRIGAFDGTDERDPTWVDVGGTPTQSTSLSAIKARFLDE
jgi:hypothetical protein